MRTKASHSMSYEFVALFFGKVYGNETDPLCGEPEINFGESFRANIEFKDYIIDCLNQREWKDSTPKALKNFVYNQNCIGDMFWNGTRPRCVPIETCSLEKVLNETTTNQTKENPLVVDSISKFYNYVENQTIYTVVGSELLYACATVDYILVGKNSRTCKRDFTWSGTEPVCKCK